MKKKILTVALVVAVIATVVGGTLAYFTAEDAVTNTFTVGSVLIDIYENGTITNEDVIAITKPLTPVVNTTTPSADESYIHKAIKVQSNGENAAYIRSLIAIPTNLVDYLVMDVNTADGWTELPNTFAVTVENVNYTVYLFDYTKPVDPDAFTPDVLKGVYLASDVDVKDNPATSSADLEFCKPDVANGGYIFSNFVAHSKVTDGYQSATVKMLIAAQAIQAQGFDANAADAATAALNTGFPIGTNPWETVVTP